MTEPMACLANAEMEIAPTEAARLKILFTFNQVLVEGAKSADPPSKVGRNREMAFRTLPDASRVAMGLSVWLKTGS